jgi:hypothetical protein
MKILGHEPRHRNAVAFIDPVGNDQFRKVITPGDESQFEQVRSRFCDALQRGALEGAIAAPLPCETEHLHGTCESTGDAHLLGIEGEVVMALAPLELVAGISSGDECLIGHAASKCFLKCFSRHEHDISLRGVFAICR